MDLFKHRGREFWMLVNKSIRLRTLTVHSTENIAALREQPSPSTRYRFQQLGIACTSLKRFWRKDLAWHQYKAINGRIDLSRPICENQIIRSGHQEVVIWRRWTIIFGLKWLVKAAVTGLEVTGKSGEKSKNDSRPKVRNSNYYCLHLSFLNNQFRWIEFIRDDHFTENVFLITVIYK